MLETIINPLRFIKPLWTYPTELAKTRADNQ